MSLDLNIEIRTAKIRYANDYANVVTYLRTITDDRQIFTNLFDVLMTKYRTHINDWDTNPVIMTLFIYRDDNNIATNVDIHYDLDNSQQHIDNELDHLASEMEQ